MVHWTCIAITNQILLADLSDVAVFAVFREQVIERLFTAWSHFGRDRVVPFLAVGEDGIDIEYHTTKIEGPVSNDIANSKAGMADRRG